MWIVLGEERGRIKLVSKNEVPGLIPKGSFLTIEDENNKHILRVDDSQQTEPYSPSPLLADMDLTPLKQDQKCQNIIYAYRVKDIINRNDGYIDYIHPQSIARRSNQEEIDLALESKNIGLSVFIGTVYASKNQLLSDENGTPIKTTLPDDMFFHQILICGKTGSGKTVAAKYMAQYFVEDFRDYGAVLAINVKDVDFLKMDQPSLTKNEMIIKEWASLNLSPHGVKNYVIYYPANTIIDPGQGVDLTKCKSITLDVKKIDPESLTGLLQGISEIGSQHLPNIFRWWQTNQIRNRADFTFADFVRYFEDGANQGYIYPTLNIRGDPGTSVPLPWGTYNNIYRSIQYALEFFDNLDAHVLNFEDILVRGKMSIINVTGNKGIQFGSTILRQLLKDIVDAKSRSKSKVPILIIIDEVHQFYNTESSKEALGELDTICRTGRSKEIGVIFSSQNPSDIPRGLSNVINTKFFFSSESNVAREFGINIAVEEIQYLKKGYAISFVYESPQLRILKFPLSLSGVFEKEEVK